MRTSVEIKIGPEDDIFDVGYSLRLGPHDPFGYVAYLRFEEPGLSAAIAETVRRFREDAGASDVARAS